MKNLLKEMCGNPLLCLLVFVLSLIRRPEAETWNPQPEQKCTDA